MKEEAADLKNVFSRPEGVIDGLAGQHYIADQSIGMAIFLALRLEKPLLAEGEPGCGKTDIAPTLAATMGTDLIRLQCYEGLDANATLYEWNYPKQLLTIRLEEQREKPADLEAKIFSDRFLLKRPLLQALTHDGPRPPVLLIDEIDRADEEFEGLLLELLSDFQVTIPEVGTIRANRRPFVLITSNRTRELSDALKRRCLYLYIEYPSLEKEVAILRRKVPDLEVGMVQEICTFVQRVRANGEIIKRPGVAETLDWAAALLELKAHQLTRETIVDTLGSVAKEAEDLRLLEEHLDLFLGAEG